MARARRLVAPARVVRDPLVCGGEPTIQGTRVPVRSIVIQWRYRGDLEGVRRAYPRLDIPAIREALGFYEQNREEIDRLIEQNERAVLLAEPSRSCTCWRSA